MQQHIRSLVIAVSLALFAISPAYALDGRTIDRWLDSMEELQAWGEDQPDDVGRDIDGEMDDPMNFDFEEVLAESAREHREVRNIISRHGFDADEWASTGSRIFNAYMAIAMEGASAEMDQEMQQAMRELDENPHMSEEQKQMMRQQMQQSMGAMSAFGQDVPDADKRAVQGKKGRLDQFFDADEG